MGGCGAGGLLLLLPGRTLRSVCWFEEQSSGPAAPRATIRKNHAVVTGEPCSVTNTYGLRAGRSRRNARSSGPRSGCTLSAPPFAWLTCIRPWVRSIADQRNAQSSAARGPCRYARRIAAASRSGLRLRLRAAPTLAATTKNLGDSIEIRIRDNGTGIPPEVKEKLFSPFFTTKPAGEGTGLGLSISHDIIVKQHGGSIEVDTQRRTW
jgi:hypothetical protein